MPIKMPEPLQLGSHSSSTMGAILIQKSDFDPKFDNPAGLRTVMGFPVPEWQRPLVWSEEQKTRFIESIWLGMPLGTYTINRSGLGDPVDHILIDGQQRLSAIEAYLGDELEVFGAKWSEVDIIDRRAFKSRKFARYETQSDDVNFLKNYYNLMNFGGTAHLAEERAEIDDDRGMEPG